MNTREITVQKPSVDPAVANTMGAGKKSRAGDEQVKKLESAVDDTDSKLSQLHALSTKNKDEKANTSELPESVKKEMTKIAEVFENLFRDINFKDMDPGDISGMLAAIQDLLLQFEVKIANKILGLKGKQGVVAVKQLMEFVRKANEATEKRFQAGEVGAAAEFASSIGGLKIGPLGLASIVAGYVLKSVQASLDRDAGYASTDSQFAQDMSQTQGKQESSSEQEFSSIKGDFQKALDELARNFANSLQLVFK